MTETLKQEIIKSLTLLDSWKGKQITIIDRISTIKDNFDRHFTTTSEFILELENFGVRTSGAIARIEGSEIVFQFRTGNIKTISQRENKIVFDIKIKESIFRKIEIEIKNPE